MPLDEAQRITAFRALQPLLACYAKRWKAKLDFDTDDALGYYRVDVKGPGSPAFATLFAHLTDVRIYFHPLHIWKDLAEILPAAVRKRIVSGSIVAFKTPVTPADQTALATLFAAAVNRIDERMKLAPKIPYTKKLTAKQQAALEPKAAARKPPAARRPPEARPGARRATAR